MKKYITILYLLASLVFVTSCQKELPDNIGSYIAGKGGQSQTTPDTPTSELKVSELGQFEAKGGELTITVTASGGWTINKSTGSDWLTISPESGKAGTTNVALKATENTATEPRKTTISLLSGDITKNVEVTQAGANREISLDTSNLEFTSAGGSKTFKITTNTSWTVESDQTWCSVSPASGKNDGTITVKLTENTSVSERTAMITVKSDVGDQTVKVIQGGAEAELTLSLNSIDFTSDIGSRSFTITSNTSWTISSDQTWCSVSPTSGSNGGSVTVKVGENSTTAERTATITVKSDAGDQTVKVTQSGVSPTLTLSVSNMEFAAGSGSKIFSIKSNTAWAVSSDKNWCSVNPTSGSNNGSVTVKVSENTQISARTATITVKTDAGIRTVSVTQSGASGQVSLSVSDMEFASGSGSKIFSIKSNTAWAVSSNKNWCSVSPTSGSGDGSVTVSVDENTSTSSRTATITVESATIKRTLAVTQNGVTPTPTPTPASQDRTFTVGGVTFKMIAVEGGTFTMGATSEQGSDAYDDEKPTHSVTLSSYSTGETEVTQALWQAVMGQKPTSDGSQWSSSYGLGGNYPAYYVSWNDCQDFIRRLNALTGENFRLPTEAEWEYAARGGNKSRGYKYAGSNNIDNVAWYYYNSGSQTHNVATKSPNELGLYDMSGNVLEWCQDWYGSYSSGSQTNPTGPSSGSYRVSRDGSWYYDARDCRVAVRSYFTPDNRYINFGLRLAL